MDAMIFLLDVPKHCIHRKTMGPLGAWSFVVVAPTIHNNVQSGNLSSRPKRHVLQELWSQQLFDYQSYPLQKSL
jgi:hypothetical protein